METEEIAKRAKANDAAALAMLVEAYSPKAREVCFGITHEDEELPGYELWCVFESRP